MEAAASGSYGNGDDHGTALELLQGRSYGREQVQRPELVRREEIRAGEGASCSAGRQDGSGRLRWRGLKKEEGVKGGGWVQLTARGSREGGNHRMKKGNGRIEMGKSVICIYIYIYIGR